MLPTLNDIKKVQQRLPTMNEVDGAKKAENTDFEQFNDEN